VQHLSDAVKIRDRERLRDVFGDAVAERIRMAEPLSLDDLDVLSLDRAADNRLDADVTIGHYDILPLGRFYNLRKPSRMN
jgi:hypothetical protein